MSERKLRIAGAQIAVSSDVAANEQRILRAIGQAAEDRADFLLTPEGSLSGYRADFGRTEVAEATERVADAARAAGVGLALGTCYKELGRPELALREYEVVLGFNPDHLKARYNSGVVHLIMAHRGKAKELWQEVVDRAPQSSVASQARARLAELAAD